MAKATEKKKLVEEAKAEADALRAAKKRAQLSEAEQRKFDQEQAEKAEKKADDEQERGEEKKDDEEEKDEKEKEVEHYGEALNFTKTISI